MIGAVAGRFGLDAEEMPMRKVERYFARHARMVEEEKGAIASALEAARGRN